MGNPHVCDEIMMHHYDTGSAGAAAKDKDSYCSVLLAMPPYESHWMKHVLAQWVTDSALRLLVTEEARRECHQFHN
jgi:hypothetical protein